MIELVILIILLEEKSSIYGLKQKIDEIFSFFASISLGTIHPALNRLEKNNYISVKKELSSGGQRKSLYSITQIGKDYAKELMEQELPENPSLASQLMKLKLMSLSKFELDTQKLTLKAILQHLYYQKNKLNLFLNNQRNEHQKSFIKHEIKKMEKDIEFLQKI